MRQRPIGQRMRLARAATAAVGAVVGMVGCADITKVAAPDLTEPSALQNAAGAQVYRVGALGMFGTEFSFWVSRGGLFTDEMTSMNGTEAAVDRRTLPDGDGAAAAAYNGARTYWGPATRVNTLIAIDLLERYSPTATGQIAELFAVLGAMETVMAEHLCAGVPLSTVANDVPVAGPSTTSVQLYAHALAQFDSAAHYATDSTLIQQWAAVGRARVLVDLDSLPAAAAATASVPTSFVYQVLYPGDLNAPTNVLSLQMSEGIIGVADGEGSNGLPFVSAADPRVPTDSIGTSSNGLIGDYAFTPQETFQAPLNVAGGVEARLIEAELALAQSNIAGWLTDLNALRTDGTFTVDGGGNTVYNPGTGGVAGLAPLSDPGTDSGRVSLQFSERALWMYGTGHRLGDLRRLIRQYGRTQAQVFPTGSYQNSGQPYGTDVTFPLIGENGNPNVPECTDRAP